MTSTNRRARLLEEMGIGPLWVSRQPASMRPAQPTPQAQPEQSVQPAPAAALKDAPISAQTLNQESAWHTDAAPVTSGVADSKPLGSKPSADEVSRMNWIELKAAVSTCIKCGLCQSRTHTVFGTGDEKAKWLFVGEGPGYNEDLQGEPFIGAAGKLLDNMLLAMGLRRGENAYIANIVKCRPTDGNGRDRPPTAEESAACLPYLERQIALIQPAIIVALGKTAALSLLGADPATPVSKLRGTVHRHGNLPLVVTYHPAYLLRKLDDKAKAWRDLCLAMSAFAGHRDDAAD